MDFVKIIFFISFTCVLPAEQKLPAGTCVSKIVKGRLVQVGDCEKNDGSEIARLIKKSLVEKKTAGNECGVIYDSKCFRSVLYNVTNVTFVDAEPICKSMNYGIPANIYDLAHYQLVLPYLRSLIPVGEESAHIWTGLEYKNNQLLLSNGGPFIIETEVWNPTFPKNTTWRTNVALRIDNIPNRSQGIYNTPPTADTAGVICEI
ncbi:uncharacterized protein LOC120341382 [Styela clava]